MKVQTLPLSFLSKLILALILIFSTTGCSIAYLTEKISFNKKFQESRANVLSTGELSIETRQELRILSLEKDFEKEPEKTLMTLENSPLPGRVTEQALALAELAFYHAEKLFIDNEKERAAKYYLMAAANAYDFLFYYKEERTHSFVSSYGRNITEIYNASLGKLVSIHQTEHTVWTLPWKSSVSKTTYNIQPSENPEEQVSFYKSDEFYSAYELRVQGLKNFYSTSGIGAPIVRKTKITKDSAHYDPFFPEVLSVPLTMMMHFSKREKAQTGLERDVTVAFLDPYMVNTTTINNQKFPLEADFSTSFGAMLSDLKPGALDLDRLLNPEKYLDKIGLKFIQTFDPKKIPVVLVHGLYSSPATYIQMANDLLGVESIRRKYQFWVFGYPTGLPILTASTRLRSSLIEANSIFNPQGNNENFNKMVIVGHSMGGILSRSMILETSQNLYASFVTVPIEKLDLTAKEKADVELSLIFEPLPFIDRAILIASPLRGSKVAQFSIVERLSKWFISIPKALTSSRYSILSKNRKYLNPNISSTDYINVPLTSVDNLRTDSPLLKAYSQTPTVPNLPVHTIIAIGESVEGPGSSDGVVPYESAHLDDAVSELLVHDQHSCLDNPKTIAEVRRVLLTHIAEL